MTEDIPVQTQDAESVVVNTAKNAQITTQDSNANDDAIADDGKTEVKSVSVVSEQQNTSFDDSDTKKIIVHRKNFKSFLHRMHSRKLLLYSRMIQQFHSHMQLFRGMYLRFMMQMQ